VPSRFRSVSGERFHARISAAAAGTNFLQIVLDDGVAAAEACGTDPLQNQMRRQGAIALQPFLDGVFERIEFTGSRCSGALRDRVLQILGHGVAAQLQMPGNAADGPVFRMQAVNGVNGFRV
jgi:hypothetical protein